jgi:hypothetical protein
MNKLSTRTRITIVAIATTVVYILLSNIDLNSVFQIATISKVDYLKAIVLGLFLYAGTAWALFFRIKGERFVTVLLFPAIGVMALSLLIELIVISVISSAFGQIAVTLVSALIIGVFAYICLLTVNILNTSYLENIPLAQAGRAAMFIIALIDAYLIFFMLYSNDLIIPLRLGLIALFSALLTYIALWSIELKISDRFYVTFAIALMLSFIGGILSIWPMQAPYLALVMSLFFYVFMNIAMEVREIIGRWIWVEYIILFVLVAVLLITMSEWGINGPLF